MVWVRGLPGLKPDHVQGDPQVPALGRRPLPTPGRSSSLAPLRPLPIWSPALRQPGPTPSSRPLLPSQEMASAAAPAAPSSAEDAEEGLRWRKAEWAGGHALASAATGGGGGAGTTGSCKVRAS